MQPSSETQLDHSPAVRKQWSFGYLLAMLAGATVALIFSLMFGVSWQEGAMLIGVGAVLMSGALFTFLEVRRLAHKE